MTPQPTTPTLTRHRPGSSSARRTSDGPPRSPGPRSRPARPAAPPVPGPPPLPLPPHHPRGPRLDRRGRHTLVPHGAVADRAVGPGLAVLEVLHVHRRAASEVVDRVGAGPPRPAGVELHGHALGQ